MPFSLSAADLNSCNLSFGGTRRRHFGGLCRKQALNLMNKTKKRRAWPCKPEWKICFFFVVARKLFPLFYFCINLFRRHFGVGSLASMVMRCASNACDFLRSLTAWSRPKGRTKPWVKELLCYVFWHNCFRIRTISWQLRVVIFISEQTNKSTCFDVE